MVRSVAVLAGVWTSCLAAQSAVPLSAASDDRGAGTSIRHYNHDRFGQSEGAPTGLGAIAQTPDGYLWLGSRDGLWRFDGASFERIEAPRGTPMARAGVQSLLVTRRGDLWIGLGQGAGVVRYRGGTLVDMKLPNPPAAVTDLVEGTDNTIWAGWGGIANRLWRLRGGRWMLVDRSMGLPPGYMMRLVRGRDGTLWIPVMGPGQNASGIARLAPGTNRFAWLRGSYDYPAVAEDPHGHLWISDRRGTRMTNLGAVPGGGAITYPAVPGVRLPYLALDPHGGIWGTTQGRGIFHIRAAEQRAGSDSRARVETFAAANGLSSDYAREVMVDREHNVWVTSEAGLDRFRLADITAAPSVPVDPVGGIVLVRAGTGVVYIVSRGRIYRVRPGERPQVWMPDRGTTAMCPTSDGVVLIESNARALRVKDDGSSTVVRDAPKDALGCAEDARRRIWVQTSDRAMWWHDVRGWHRAWPGGLSMLGSGLAVGDGGTTVAFVVGRTTIAIVRGDRMVRIRLSRPGFGDITSVDAGTTGFLVSTVGGLFRIRNGQIRHLDAERYPWLTATRTIIQTARDQTWFYGVQGLVRTAAADLDHAFDHPGTAIPRRLFDIRDGMPGGLQRVGFSGPQLVEGGDGRLWMATSAGAATIDPAKVMGDSAIPRPAIQSLIAGGTSYRDPARLDLPNGTTTVRILYTAANLSTPDRVRFRYRLEDVDEAWMDAGGRRGTIYTNLGPGRYHFAVAAGNGTGAWSRAPATLDFEIRPTFTQSMPFRLFCGALVLAMVWFAYRLRMRAVAANVRARMAARHDERERIARDLHDTLLQSVHALILRFQLAAAALPEQQPARQGLELALEDAEHVIAEGRSRVGALRATGSIERLKPMLVDIVRRLPLEDRVTRTVSVMGDPRALEPAIADEIGAIATEALFNAAVHAHPSRIDIDVIYRPNSVTVRCCDDGVGIAPSVLRDGYLEGHFGLTGMRERAHRLQGELIIDAQPGGGTQIILIVPAAVAYIDGRKGRWTRLRTALFAAWRRIGRRR